ncbi:hypothetical protein [Haloferula sp. A504]|uniref:hypothetical protein n=1 Tax=Haloferula sp. A504 TaxID=3373601 RepID=UPI0031BF1375|nr:LamG domain-containing protein [Verrucomicrobiaceae bacterium E54]
MPPIQSNPVETARFLLKGQVIYNGTGAAPGDPTLDADIDELHILRAALSDDEISTLMEQNVVDFR